MVYPIITRVSTIQGGAGFLPSTVSYKWVTSWVLENFKSTPLAKNIGKMVRTLTLRILEVSK